MNFNTFQSQANLIPGISMNLSRQPIKFLLKLPCESRYLYDLAAFKEPSLSVKPTHVLYQHAVKDVSIQDTEDASYPSIDRPQVSQMFHIKRWHGLVFIDGTRKHTHY